MMKINNKIFCVLMIFFSSVLLTFSQSPQQNLDKYWDYRTRFFNKFIADRDWLYSPRNGINIPAGIYNSERIGTRERTVSWGDTQQNIAKYLGAMATEYQILKCYNLDLSNVKTKLHRGLVAMERLDWDAEIQLGCDPPSPGTIICEGEYYSNKNGFFFRDDMDAWSFEQHAEDGNDAWKGLELKSDYDNWLDNGEGNLMSQDMFWHLLLGYSLIAKYVDALDTYQGYDCADLTLKERAQYQAYLMHRYMQSVIYPTTYTFLPIGIEFPGKWYSPNWWDKFYLIKNPCTGDIPIGGGLVDLEFNSSMFRDATALITEDNFGGVTYPGYAYPDISNLPVMPITNNYYNNVGKLIPSAICDDYYADDLDELFYNIRLYADYYNQPIVDNPYDIQYFTLDYLPLLNVLLWDKDPYSKLWSYFYSHVEQLLNEAPPVLFEDGVPDGPYSNVFPPVKKIWSQPSMFDCPLGDYISDPNNERLLGEYNGLDYMLLFNLYHLVYENCFNEPVNIEVDFPTNHYYQQSHCWYYGSDDINIGHQDNAAYFTVISKDLITMNTKVNWNGKVGLRGNEVLLQPGFEVVLGGEFTAENLESMNLDFTPPPSGLKGAMVTQNISNDLLTNELFDNRNADHIGDHLQIYPNPASDFIFIESDYLYTEITIYNSNGLIVAQTCNDSHETQSVDVSGFNSGIYIVKVTSDDGQSEIRKFIVQ